MSDFFSEPQDDNVDSFLPDAVEPLDAEDEFSQTEILLGRELDEDDLIVSDPEPEPIGQSWAFDFERNEFRSGGGHGPLKTRGYATVYNWIEKCLKTDRGAHPVHPPEYGVERPFDMIGQPVTRALGDDLESRISEALTFHPRIADVRDFKKQIDRDEDSVALAFTVLLDDDTELPVQVRLP